MKKFISLLILCSIGILISMLIPEKEPVFLTKTSENVKVIAHFDRTIISGKSLINLTEDFKSKKVRRLLEKYKIGQTRAVFRNRYDTTGTLLNSNLIKKNLHFLEGWQEILVNKNNSTLLVSLLKKQVGVKEAFVERPIGLKPFMSTNDPYYQNNLQWNLKSNTNPTADIDAEAAWDINRGRNDVIVAVIDGGVDYTHQDLDLGDRNRVIAGFDFGNFDSDPMDDLPEDGYSYGNHGTKIAGTIGAITNNGTGVAGIMWNCKIMPIKVVSSYEIRGPFGGTIFDFSQIALPSVTAMGINYAVNNNAHIINLSQGISGLGYSLAVVTGELSVLYDAILDAYENNVVIVAAMGNEHNKGNPVEYPAGFNEVIAVGETNNLLERVSTSNTGPNIDVSAPGEFMTTSRNNNYNYFGGTSSSTPVVAGIAGLIISQGMDRGMSLTNDDVKHILEQTADDINPAGWDEATGFGKVNAFHALSLLASPNTLTHSYSIGGTATEINTLNPWIYVGSGAKWGLVPGSYYGVSQYSITRHIYFPTPFCTIPRVWLREKESICLSFANPNLGSPWAQISNISQTGFDVTYAAYYVRYNFIGQTLNKWVPANLYNVKIEYTAVGVTSPVISGPSTVCPTSTEFTMVNLPGSSTINWTCSQNITRISEQGSNPCQFEANGSGEYGWIDATVTFNGNQYDIPQRNVWVGSDLQNPVNISITGEYGEFVEHTNDMWELCPNTNYLLRASGSGISGWDWTIPESWEFLSNENYPEVLIQTGDNILWEDVVQVDVYNGDCATWLYNVDYLTVTEPPYGIGCGESLQFNLYPNPAKNILTIQINEKELTKASPSNYNISIVDKFGRVILNRTSMGNLLTLDISNLLNGEYTIIISRGKTVNSQRFIKSN